MELLIPVINLQNATMKIDVSRDKKRKKNLGWIKDISQIPVLSAAQIGHSFHHPSL